MDDGDDESSMDNELRQLRRTLVRVSAVPNEQLRKVAELGDREIGSERRLPSLLSDDAYTCSVHQQSTNAGGREDAPTSAAWIMETSFPPSPIQQTRFFVCARMRRATSAFWVGEQRQATTAAEELDRKSVV